VNASDANGAHVTLDASATRDLAGPATAFTWTIAGTACPIATGSKADVILPVGIDDVTLAVTDAQGNTSRDDVIVSVTAP
jgi:hypothetical protein